jgi:RNase P subunit RPR2
MPKKSSTPRQSFKDRLPTARKILCKKCYRQLCQSTEVHDGNDEQSALFIKHKRLEILALMVVITCPNCGSKFRIEAGRGIVDEYLNTYHDNKRDDRGS